MRRPSFALAAVAFLALGGGFSVAQAQPGFVSTYLDEARGQLAAGDVAAARAAVDRALERDERSLPALELLADVALRQQDVDTAVHALHRWLDVADARSGRRPGPARKVVSDRLLPLDSEAPSWGRLQAQYVTGLLDIGRQYRQKKDLLGALEVYQHLLLVSPDHPEALAAIQQIRTTGGREVAVEDVYAGSDPTGGLAEEELAKMDAEHTEWDKAYTDQSDNYRYRTNAGYLVLKTSRIAMEQMNGFYRRFFRFQQDGGKTPPIEIRIFKNREEYLKLGRSPQPWSAGQFTGDAVETYAGGVSGKESVREMYGTLFHEAAHQFVSMTGPMVPGWLNEAYASFFEGCVILSNGSVQWNRVPPGRLFPLAARLERGWMASIDEAAPGPDGTWKDPAGAPTLAMIVAGGYPWGPPWYAPTWGLVYFLYNYRHADGRPVYRDALHAYYQSFRRGQPKDPIVHFEQTVLLASPLSPVRAIGELDPIWKQWVLGLRDRHTGKLQQGDELLAWAKAALERGEQDVALEFLEEARGLRPADPEVLWQLAGALELAKKKAQAAARYREFRRALEVSGKNEDKRHGEAGRKIDALDPLVGRYRALKQKLAEQGLQLARGYEARQLPTMALEIARRMTASYSIPAAMDYYVELAERTGKSLARWRVAYDERSLKGWSGGGDGSFQAYGKLLRAQVPRDAERMVTRELTCDVTFDADFSLAAELQILARPDGTGFQGDLVGLCFGRKGDNQFHAVMLHPKGFLDVSSNRGGEWTVHDHRSVPVGSDWHQLRIDVTRNQLDVYFDGLYVRSLDFPDDATVRGGFGLLCGPGEAQFRNVRVLGRDPFDPAARIERELAMAKVLADPGQRPPGTFSGLRPPELGALQFVQGEATTLAALRPRPVMLVFWSPTQDRVIPCTNYLRHAMERGAVKGLTAVVVADAGTRAGDLTAYLAENPLPGALVAIDGSGATYDAYFVKPGFFGMPRILLLDADGKVVFEGDPGLRAGVGWKPEDGPTYVDGALDKLLGG
jgi:tetratricopeptide (TPR) repeat protein